MAPVIARLRRWGGTGNADDMPDRPYRAVDDLIRRVQRVAANRADPLHILAETISLIGESDVDPYAILGVLIEGAAHTIARHIPTERQAENSHDTATLAGRASQCAWTAARRSMISRIGMIRCTPPAVKLPY